jgi:diguanylate cyclase (GGDEF)-like protein
MLGRPRRPSTPETNAPADAMTLVVYHSSADVEQHVAPLRSAAGLHLEFIRKGSLAMVPDDAAGVLWEITPDDATQRLAPALIGQVPAVSYSASPSAGLVDVSRALGFREHLMLPLRLEDVARALGLSDAVDLADRIDAATPRIMQVAGDPDALSSIVRVVNISMEPAEVASTLARQVQEWLPLSAWHVLTLAPDGGLQWPAGPDGDGPLRIAIESFADIVAHTGQPAVRVTNCVDPRAGDALQGRHVEASAIGWPLVAGGLVVGVVIGLDVGRARRLPELQPTFTAAFGRLLEPAAFALGHALRVARAEALSVTDDLTQLYNSRYLNDALRKETKRAMRSGWPLSLLFIDLDGFKRVNDAHGHLLGSRALIDAAALIRSCGRETDIIARFGGDEFAILLPETGTEGAQAVARRLRDRIQRYVFLPEHGSGNRLTASIGVATLPDVADTPEGLLQAADAAMYHVKVAGKNGIHVAGSQAEAGLREPEQELP